MRNYKFYIVLSCLLLVLSCSDKKPGVSYFPASSGNQWQYHYVTTATTDTSSNVLAVQDITWIVIKDTTISGVNTIQFLTIDSDYYSGIVNQQHSYYISNEDGFYIYGVDSPTITEPVFMPITTINPQMTNTKSPKSGNAKSVFMPNSSIRLLQFPIVIGDIWTSKVFFNGTLPFKRKYLDSETLTTSSGTFPCTKLEEFEDANNDGIPDSNSLITYEWYSDKGFIMRKDSVTGTNVYGTVNDTLITITTLQSLNVK